MVMTDLVIADHMACDIQRVVEKNLPPWLMRISALGVQLHEPIQGNLLL
jgi:hypothetical protein